MIRLLLKIVTWLNTRFPPKLVVTEHDFKELLRKETEMKMRLESISNLVEGYIIKVDFLVKNDQLQNDVNGETNEHFEKLDDSIKALKDLISKSQGPAAEIRRRAEFIQSGRITE